jgi:hypothetical protein
MLHPSSLAEKDKEAQAQRDLARQKRRREREEALAKKAQESQNINHFGASDSQSGSDSDDDSVEPRDNPEDLGAFRNNKNNLRHNSHASGQESEKENCQNPSSNMGATGKCNKRDCLAAQKEAVNYKTLYDQEVLKNANLTEENAKLNGTIDKLRSGVTTLKGNLKNARDNCGSMEVASSTVTVINAKVKECLFSKYQFVLGDDAEKRVAKKVYLKCYSRMERKSHHANFEAQWIKTYMPTIKAAFKAERHFRTQQVKTACYNWVKEGLGGGVLPTRELFLKCLLGTIDPKKPEEVECMVWIWDKMMGAACGQTNWGPNIRAHTLMCKAVSQNDKQVSHRHLAGIHVQYGIYFY